MSAPFPLTVLLYGAIPDTCHVQPKVAFKIAQALKVLGTTAFKAQDWPTAQSKYLKSLRYLDLHPSLAERNIDFEEEMTALRLSLLLNSALVAIKSSTPLKAEDGRLAIKQATRALTLEGDSIRAQGTKTLSGAEKAKALYRRAQGYMAVKEEAKAIADLIKALEWAPEDGGIKLALAEAKIKVDKEKKRLQGAYGKMFA